jgi:lycopene cyclase domain-containing protein
MSLYAILLLASISIPLLLSFDRKLHFYTRWKYVLPAISVVAAIYIAFDVYFTHQGFWGFNHDYHGNTKLLGLPIEEWLFFIVVPYASLFLHYSFVLYFPQIKLSDRITQSITRALLFGLIIVIAFNYQRAYTVYIIITMIVTLGLAMLENSKLLNQFYITFILILIPFLIVNGILTGSFIDGVVVWYNDAENIGKRFFTIPYEDFLYAFSMIYLGLLLTETIASKGGIFRKEASK